MEIVPKQSKGAEKIWRIEKLKASWWRMYIDESLFRLNTGVCQKDEIVAEELYSRRNGACC